MVISLFLISAVFKMIKLVEMKRACYPPIGRQANLLLRGEYGRRNILRLYVVDMNREFV